MGIVVLINRLKKWKPHDHLLWKSDTNAPTYLLMLHSVFNYNSQSTILELGIMEMFQTCTPLLLIQYITVLFPYWYTKCKFGLVHYFNTEIIHTTIFLLLNLHLCVIVSTYSWVNHFHKVCKYFAIFVENTFPFFMLL